MPKIDLTRLALGLALSIAAADPASAQPSAPQPPWTGWARCQISVAGTGYTDQQTHTWMITAGAPTVSGAFSVYPGTWSAVGGGSVQTTHGNQTRMAQWAMNTPNISAPIAVFVRASDGRMFIQARHAQLRSPASVQGYQQLIIDGKPQTPGKIASEAFEWAFPDVVVSRPNPNANLVANGSSTPIVKGSVGLMQPAFSRVAASCTWQFNQGAPTPPPPTLAAQAIPTPPASGVASTPPPAGAGSGGAGSTPACTSPPQNLVASVPPPATYTVTFQWAAPANGVATDYVLRAGSAPGLMDQANYTLGSTQTFLTASGAPGTFYIRVHAVNNCMGGLSAASNEVVLVIP